MEEKGAKAIYINKDREKTKHYQAEEQKVVRKL